MVFYSKVLDNLPTVKLLLYSFDVGSFNEVTGPEMADTNRKVRVGPGM